MRNINNTGLWDFAWWVHQEVNFSPRITQIALIFYFFSREFALFAVDFSSTMRNPKEPTIQETSETEIDPIIVLVGPRISRHEC